jgi:hypothetical protein
VDQSGNLILAGATSVVAASVVNPLGPAVPNPFNPQTTIQYHNPYQGPVNLAIYDCLGHRVRVLLSGFQPEGRGQVRWDGRDESGRAVASGIYFIRGLFGSERVYGKVTLLR